MLFYYLIERARKMNYGKNGSRMLSWKKHRIQEGTEMNIPSTPCLLRDTEEVSSFSSESF